MKPTICLYTSMEACICLEEEILYKSVKATQRAMGLWLWVCSPVSVERGIFSYFCQETCGPPCSMLKTQQWTSQRSQSSHSRKGTKWNMTIWESDSVRKQSHQEDVREMEGAGSRASVVRSSDQDRLLCGLGKEPPKREPTSKCSALRVSSCP